MPILIKWNKRAFTEFIKVIEYIKLDSPKNAANVKEEILSTILKLTTQLDFFNPDKYKLHVTKFGLLNCIVTGYLIATLKM